MLIVDASTLYEVLVGGARAPAVVGRLAQDGDHAAPHVLDAEVLGALRKDVLLGQVDQTTARMAIRGLRDWGGRRFSHASLLERAWELRANVRTWDALYVALAEALGAPLITLDRRLAGAASIRCQIEVV
jgi:predicted nucleic acid-binding protein